MIDLTVSIVAYKNYDDIVVAIDSLEKYTSNQISKKIYVLDNGRKEIKNSKFEAFLKRLNKYKDVNYIDLGKNVGFGKGHNYIISKINSKYHCIMNPDIIFVEDAFLKIIEYMDRYEDIGMVIPRIIDEHGNLQHVYRKEVTVFDMFIRMFCKGLFNKRYNKHTLQYKDYTKPFQVPFGQGSFLVVRTKLFIDLEGFDDRFFMYMEDADLCKRVNSISRLMYYPEASVIHKWEKGSHRNFRLFRYHLNSMIFYFKKWGVKLY